MSHIWNLLIKNALVFDGTGEPPQTTDVACQDGKFAARGKDLDPALAARTVDAAGKWLMPGLLDIHTHLDLEIEGDPRLTEAVRHGTTSVVVGNCSIGLAFGALCNAGYATEQPIIDCFARVENIPRSVLAQCANNLTWTSTGGYLRCLEQRHLGPNVAPLVPHSMLRVAVMGWKASISRQPTVDELGRMRALLEEAMQQGYCGLSTDFIALHYVANEPHRKIPGQYALYKEVKALTDVVRAHDGIWQTTLDSGTPFSTLRLLMLSSARLHGKALRTTALAAMDVWSNQGVRRSALNAAAIVNSRWVGGHLIFQTLAAPFKVYASGVMTPVLEEFPSCRELLSLDIDDVSERRRILDDPSFVRRFRREWDLGKSGSNFSRLRKILRIESSNFNRELADMHIDTCPLSEWNGQNLGAIFSRLLAHQRRGGGHAVASGSAEATFFDRCPDPVKDEATFMLHLLREFDLQFRWHTTTANRDPEVLKALLFHPHTLPGFNDSGAHLVNMAYYDGNLRTLAIAAGESVEKVAVAVKRLTQDAARLFALDAGSLDLGKQADMILIDPVALAAYDSEASMEMSRNEAFGCEQFVNRSDGVVPLVVIAGKVAWEGSEVSSQLGCEPFGRVLKNQFV